MWTLSPCSEEEEMFCPGTSASARLLHLPWICPVLLLDSFYALLSITAPFLTFYIFGLKSLSPSTAFPSIVSHYQLHSFSLRLYSCHSSHQQPLAAFEVLTVVTGSCVWQGSPSKSRPSRTPSHTIWMAIPQKVELATDWLPSKPMRDMATGAGG